MRKFVGQDELALRVRRPVSDDQFDLMTFVGFFRAVLFVLSTFFFFFFFFFVVVVVVFVENKSACG